MFIPVGIIWPIVFKELDTPARAIAAGVGFSLLIEILQLPFFDRVSDIDDLLLNTLGFAAGYGIYRLSKLLKVKKETK
jgi:glycopeptide antibiotics resistance protein